MEQYHSGSSQIWLKAVLEVEYPQLKLQDSAFVLMCADRGG